jgi:hypothetical protein
MVWTELIIAAGIAFRSARVVQVAKAYSATGMRKRGAF